LIQGETRTSWRYIFPEVQSVSGWTATFSVYVLVQYRGYHPVVLFQFDEFDAGDKPGALEFVGLLEGEELSRASLSSNPAKNSNIDVPGAHAFLSGGDGRLLVPQPSLFKFCKYLTRNSQLTSTGFGNLFFLRKKRLQILDRSTLRNGHFNSYGPDLTYAIELGLVDRARWPTTEPEHCGKPYFKANPEHLRRATRELQATVRRAGVESFELADFLTVIGSGFRDNDGVEYRYNVNFIVGTDGTLAVVVTVPALEDELLTLRVGTPCGN